MEIETKNWLKIQKENVAWNAGIRVEGDFQTSKNAERDNEEGDASREHADDEGGGSNDGAGEDDDPEAERVG